MHADYLQLDAVPTRMWERYLEAPARARLPGALRRCWDRVRSLGAPAAGLEHDAVLDVGALQERRERLDEVLSVMTEIVGPAEAAFAREDHLLVLADPDGVVVHTSGGGSFARTAREVHLVEGSTWAESLRGTNAIGTVIAEGRPVSVRGAAHFARPNHGLSCYATPVFDPYGELIAVLDATSSVRGHGGLTSVAVLSLARALEQAMREQARQELSSLERALTGPILARCDVPAVLFDARGRACEANPAAVGALPALRALRKGRSGPLVPVRGRSADLVGLAGDALRDVLQRGSLRRPTPDGRHAVELEPVVDDAGRLLMVAAFFQPAVPRSSAGRSSADRADRAQPDPFASLHGADPGLRAVIDRARQLASTRLPILLLAETGTGKGALARSMHAASDRRHAPFVAINCGAVSSQLLESELFGYAPGAFTGADPKGGQGRLPAADGGTLFLDEVAEMSPALQVALLRFLDDGCYHRVGDSQERRADVRVICATCRDLPGLVDSGQFRADLYYRIQGATLGIPPLRDRSDIVELAEVLLQAIAVDLGLSAAPRLAPDAAAAIRAAPWPGNVRQLKSALQYAAVLSADQGLLHALHLPPAPPARAAVTTRAPAVRDAEARDATGSDPCSRDAAELHALRRALAEAGGNVSGAARTLGVARSTVYRMMRKHGLKGG